MRKAVYLSGKSTQLFMIAAEGGNKKNVWFTSAKRTQ
jgi:hypothetical protein